MSYETIQQAKIEDIPKGEFIRFKLHSKKTYTREEYDRGQQAYECDDWSDIGRRRYATKGTLMWVGFDF